VRSVVRALVPDEDRDLLLGDLDERFRTIAAQRGAGAARWWYRRQALRLPPSLVGAALAGALTGLRQGGAWGWFLDGRRGLRTLHRRPAYALGFAATIGLGIGSAVIVGTVAWHAWLAPLPYPDSDGLVRVYELRGAGVAAVAGAGDSSEPAGSRLSPPLIEDWRRTPWQNLVGVAGASMDSPGWDEGGGRVTLRAHRVGAGFFELLGARPVAGRLTFREGADEVVASRTFVEAHLGGDAHAALDRVLTLDERPHRVVGVVDLGLGYPGPADLVLPLHWTEADLGPGMRGARYLEGIARLRPGATPAAAEAELTAWLREAATREPMHEGWSGRVIGLSADLAAPFRGALALLAATGAAFLLLAVVNVAGLVAARSLERREEDRVRRALGASRGALVRGSATEGLVLGGLGIGVTMALAWGLFPKVLEWLPADLPRRAAIHLGVGDVLVWSVGGLILAWLASVAGQGLTGAPPLRGGTRTVVPGWAGRRLLVVAQIGMTTTLLAAGALLAARFGDLRRTDLGFEPDGLQAAHLLLPPTVDQGPTARADAWERIVADLDARGWRAAVSNNVPLSGSTMNFGFTVEGDAEQAYGQYHSVTPGYFEVMGITLEEGRFFGPGEDAAVVVINRAFAREHFGGLDPVGRVIRLNGIDRTVVGVAGDTRHFGPDVAPPVEMYVPVRQDAWTFGTLLVRADAEASTALSAVVVEALPGHEAPSFAPWSHTVARWFAPLRIQLAVIAALGLIGTLLAALGLYTVLAFHQRARTREVGIRMALGARSMRVFGGTLRHSLALAVAGVGLGLIAWSLVVDRVSGVLGMDPGRGDWGLAAQVALAVLAVSTAAGLAPALRAIRVDPIESLRAD
jgi:predicted permease